MDNLIFSLNATMPIFLTMCLGLLFRKMKLMDDAFVTKVNKFVFNAALPCLLFQDLSKEDFASAWDTKFVLFCAGVTLFSILSIWVISSFTVNRQYQGEFVQASYRSSAAILGIAFIQNIYGNSGMAPLMIFASVPLYNMMAVVVLSFLKPDREPMNKALLLKTLKGIATNPIILGILAGLAWSLLRLPIPDIAAKTIKNVAVLATPLGLMAMGAAFDLKKATSNVKPAICAGLCKLVILAAIFLPAAVALGFRTEKLIAILVMLGSPTTVSSYIMAKNMGHEGTLTASTVMLTTGFSAFTLTVWLMVIKSLGLI